MSAAHKRTAAGAWSAGDRIGKMSRATLRELRMRTIIVGEWNHDVFVEVAEALEGLIEVVGEVTGDAHLVVEELADRIKQIGDDAESEVQEAEEEIADAKKEAEEQRERVVEMEKDYDADMLYLRKRAEKAEEALAESVRNGHVLDREADLRAKEKLRVADDLVNTQARIIADLKAQVERMKLDVARGVESTKRENDMRVELERLRASTREPSVVDRHNAGVLAATSKERDGALARANALQQELSDAHAWLEHARAARPMKKRGARVNKTP